MFQHGSLAFVSLLLLLLDWRCKQRWLDWNHELHGPYLYVHDLWAVWDVTCNIGWKKGTSGSVGGVHLIRRKRAHSCIDDVADDLWNIELRDEDWHAHDDRVSDVVECRTANRARPATPTASSQA